VPAAVILSDRLSGRGSIWGNAGFFPGCWMTRMHPTPEWSSHEWGKRHDWVIAVHETHSALPMKAAPRRSNWASGGVEAYAALGQNEFSTRGSGWLLP